MITLNGNTDGSSLLLRGRLIETDAFLLHAERSDTLVEGAVDAERIDRDIVWRDVSDATIDQGWQIFVTPLGENATEGLEMVNLSPSIGELDSFGRLTRVSDGTARVLVRGRFQTRWIDLPVARTGDAVFTEFKRYVAGSLGESCSSAIDGLLADADPETSMPLYSVRSSGNYQWNASRWLPADASCVSVWNSAHGQFRAGTLISPRHVIMAHHWQVPVGATLDFMAADGTVVQRTLTARLSHPHTPWVDVAIGLLDSDVPAFIPPAKILPTNWRDYLPNLGWLVPVIFINQDRWATVRTLRSLFVRHPDDPEGEYGTSISTYTPPDLVPEPDRLDFWVDVRGGDSGCPTFLLINGELVIASVQRDLGGDAIHHVADDINALMTTLGGDYQLTEIDLSAFTEYGE